MSWHQYHAVHLPRLRRRIDRVLVSDRAVLVLANTRAEAEAAAIDLADFHTGCEGLPVLPVAMLHGERVVAQTVLPLPGAAPAIVCTRLLLPGLLRQVERFPPVPGADPARWNEAPYRPVPGLMDAAARLYASHDHAELRQVGADRSDFAATSATVAREARCAREAGRNLAIFVTGPPGSGKTLCGLDLAFARNSEAAFLTGNPALLHVLRAALVRDAAARGLQRRAAQQRVEAVVQALRAFRDQHAAAGPPPPDRLLIIDEAQRCWIAAHAVRKTRNKPVKLATSEPAHLLDIMARHAAGAVIVGLLGGGQEIHDGEGGLAAWGDALATRPEWHVLAPPSVLEAADPRQRLPALPSLRLDPALHLGRPVRTHRAPRLPAWVDAVLSDDPAAARRIAGPDLPVRLVRTLPELREALRAIPGPGRRGLLASAGGRRLRAEGLGGLLWHQDEDAVAHWFLDAWPDIRSADALETAATEFGVQGLELDAAGLCWDLDLCRGAAGWQAQSFRATRWTRPTRAESLSNKRNAYRVLLTRARRDLLIWIPQGDARDPTRPPAMYDTIADYLEACGARRSAQPGLEFAPRTIPGLGQRPPTLLESAR